MPSLTENTKVLMSFGAIEGGFEFAYQLRWDIYKKFGRNPSSDPAFCYLDAESLRTDRTTKYTYNASVDKNFMSNDDWDSHYEAAMMKCRTMILLITKEWLRSQYCWHELDMLLRVAEKNTDMKKVVVTWPDADAFMMRGPWVERQNGTVVRSALDLGIRLIKLKNIFRLRVSGEPAFTGAVTKGYRNINSQGVTLGSNRFAYSLSEPETNLIIANVNA